MRTGIFKLANRHRDRHTVVLRQRDRIGGSSVQTQRFAADEPMAKTFTGERLGFSYSDPKNHIPVLDHKYRFCQILGIQPELAGWLLSGIQRSGGTPQRILWAPAVYPDMLRPPPGGGTEGITAVAGMYDVTTVAGMQTETSEVAKVLVLGRRSRQAGGRTNVAGQRIQIPREIETEIREARPGSITAK